MQPSSICQRRIDYYWLTCQDVKTFAVPFIKMQYSDCWHWQRVQVVQMHVLQPCLFLQACQRKCVKNIEVSWTHQHATAHDGLCKAQHCQSEACVGDNMTGDDGVRVMSVRDAYFFIRCTAFF